MAEQKLKLVLLGDDRTASKSLKGVGREAGTTGGKLSKLGGVGKAAMLGLAGVIIGAGIAAGKFGMDSVKAFADADASQKKLEDAYKRFPKVQNVNIAALRKYNDELERKRGIDADDTAAGQAQLGAYKLTGKQIKAMTPLLQDYAAKTGKSLPAAAKDLGKAVMGSGKALKGLGIDFKDQKDPAKNYAQVMAGLREKVGGFADSVPDAEKKSRILAATFGNLQESVGEKLQPAMLGLMDAGQGVIDWLSANPEVAAGASAAFDLVGQALGGVWDIIRKFVLPGLAFLVRGFAQGVSGAKSMLEALGTIPGFEWAKGAAEKLGTVVTGIETIATGMESLGKDAPPKVDVDDSKLKAKVKKIDSEVARLSKKAVKLKSEGDTSGAEKIAKRIRQLQASKAKVTVGVGFTKSGPQKMHVTTVGGTKRIALNASGTASFAGGLTMVGDGMGHSPEAVYLPQGSRILSTGQTRAAQSQGKLSGGGGALVVNHFNIQGDTNPNAAARRIARAQSQLRTSYGPGFRPVKGRG